MTTVAVEEMIATFDPSMVSALLAVARAAEKLTDSAIEWTPQANVDAHLVRELAEALSRLRGENT